MNPRNLTPEQRTELCDAAEAAWNAAPGLVTSVTFQWKRWKFKSRWTNFRMMVDTIDGKPVVCRWH